jgi:hypothetical protein
MVTEIQKRLDNQEKIKKELTKTSAELKSDIEDIK